MDDQKLMTVGELAKMTNTTVRTLQYYDREGLLKPSFKSEGGRRLYTYKDVVKLHQILSFKFLGFSLDDIKNRIVSLDSPNEVINILTKQASILQEKVNDLTQALEAVESLKEEIRQIHEVDFAKYAHIIELLRNKNNNYWVVKYFKTNTLEHIEKTFDEEKAVALVNRWGELCDEIGVLQDQNILPESREGQQLAKAWWAMVEEFTGGNMEILPELMNFASDQNNWEPKWKIKQHKVNDFIGAALCAYFQNNGINIPNIGG